MNPSDCLADKCPKKAKLTKKKRVGRALTIEQVAEAFELRQEGVYYANIAMIFGVADTTLKRYMRAAERYGYSYWDK